MEHLPRTTFRRCVARYNGEHKVKHFSCFNQLAVMVFAQLTFRESLRDIEACLRVQAGKLYHLGIRGRVARNTLSNANAVRDWRIYADFAQRLIATARKLYATEPLGVELDATVYALDSTTIDFKKFELRVDEKSIVGRAVLDRKPINIPDLGRLGDPGGPGAVLPARAGRPPMARSGSARPRSRHRGAGGR